MKSKLLLSAIPLALCTFGGCVFEGSHASTHQDICEIATPATMTLKSEDRKLCLGLRDCQKCQLAVFLSLAIGMATGKKVRAYQPEWKV